MPRPPRTAIVLSAGGVRGAYQVGVIAGIVDILGRDADSPLFDIFTGASIGAINAAYLAANAHHGDHGIDGLVRIWTELDFGDVLEFAPLGLWGWPRMRLPFRRVPDRGRYLGRALFDPRPVEDLLARVIPWDQLHANIRAQIVRGFMVAALDICDGNTTLFTELADGVTFRPYPFLATRARFTTIAKEHVLAATALPFMFPSRAIDSRYYMDGAVRFETPITPALRAGARRAVVISMLHQQPVPDCQTELVYPGVFFLIGQLLSAMLLDPLRHDTDTLQRNNRILEVLTQTLGEDQMTDVITNLDGLVPPGITIPTLVFQPSEDIEAIAAEVLRVRLRRAPIRRALLRIGHYRAGLALLSSFLLLDGRLAARLIELGRRDAHAARDRIEAFFAD